jgi:hypothetical protein
MRNFRIPNWFLMMPSIATKFQYVNSYLFSFSLTTCFGPYGPSSGGIYNWMLQWTISNTTDPLHVHDPMQRCYALHIGAPTLRSQYMLSHGYKYKSCRHKIVKIYPRGGFWAVLQFLWPARIPGVLTKIQTDWKFRALPLVHPLQTDCTFQKRYKECRQ